MECHFVSLCMKWDMHTCKIRGYTRTLSAPNYVEIHTPVTVWVSDLDGGWANELWTRVPSVFMGANIQFFTDAYAFMGAL